MKRARVVAVWFLALASGSALLSRSCGSSPGHLTPTSPPTANRSWITRVIYLDPDSGKPLAVHPLKVLKPHTLGNKGD